MKELGNFDTLDYVPVYRVLFKLVDRFDVNEYVSN